MPNLPDFALMAFLSDKNQRYYGKALELRDAVTGWLSYIPQTFPHYTAHTIDHSEEIISQVSHLLFRNANPRTPVLDELSATEAYILVAAAYLHDIGMVVSDKDKIRILGSEEWGNWVRDGGGGESRWAGIDAFRNGSVPVDSSIRHFIADMQLRHLIADFVRRNHHMRSADLLSLFENELGRFGFQDPLLVQSIANVCLAHGLPPHELDNRERFPVRAMIQGELVNVRMLAIMLRLGDLLDIRHERACPLLLNAACPLPPDSLAHWTQYQRFKHRLTAFDRVEIVAECETRDEHRYLQDWFQWLVDELTSARTMMAGSSRHGAWEAPLATMSGSDPTILIRPAPSAKYLPVNWIFELDNQAVFQRFIYDAYHSPIIFIRELIQNAADASRCQMFHDLMSEGKECPLYPTKVDQVRRYRYPIKVSLTNTDRTNALSGEQERRQILTVEDVGIGMDKEVIKRYFLQVGRSYYATDEFRRKYLFTPTSHFGVGFLSVFAVSDEVVVETCKPTSETDPESTRLTLTGPRSYLLVERGERTSTGTRIEVLLRKPLEVGELTKTLNSWCQRLEFPIVVQDVDSTTTIEAERPEKYLVEIQDVTNIHSRFAVRGFPICREGIEGELYIFAKIDKEGESWCAQNWARVHYLDKHPAAVIPRIPPKLIALHGMTVSEMHPDNTSSRLDYRGPIYRPTLSRVARQFHFDDLAVESRWDELLQDHLSTTPLSRTSSGWKYKQKLVSIVGSDKFWRTCPETIPVYIHGSQHLFSLEELLAIPSVYVVAHLEPVLASFLGPKSIEIEARQLKPYSACIRIQDWESISASHKRQLFLKKRLNKVKRLEGRFLLCEWIDSSDDFFATDSQSRFALVELPRKATIGLLLHTVGETYEECSALNSRNEIVGWIVRVKEACQNQSFGLNGDHFHRLISLLRNPVMYHGHEIEKLSEFMLGWKDMVGLPIELLPPRIRLNKNMFRATVTKSLLNMKVRRK